MNASEAWTLPRVLEWAAREHGDRPAVVDLPGGRSLTYAELQEQADRLAAGLIALGLAPGAHLALWAPNRAEWLTAWLAASRAGLVVSAVDTGMDAERLLYQLRHSDAQALVLARGMEGDDRFLTTLLQVCPESGSPRGDRLACRELPRLAHLIQIDGPALPGAWTWDEVAALGAGAPAGAAAARAAAVRPEDPATLLYTSGTTGAPKGVLSPHRGLIATSRAGAANMGLTPDDRLAASVPLCHMFGCICVALAGLVAGAALVIPSPVPEPEALLRAVDAQGVTAIFGPPTSFIALLDLPDWGRGAADRRLRTGIMAGAVCPMEVMRRVAGELGVAEVIVGYGQTEASSWITQSHRADPLQVRVTSAGRAVPGAEVMVLDTDTGRPAQPGIVGEICTRGHIMLGYYNNPSATAQAVDAQGWLHTGDLGTLDEEGLLTITGRLKEVIRSGGALIFPAQVEDVLFGHPAVNNVQVFGVPHDELGEEVACWVKLNPGAAATAEDLAQWLAGRVRPEQNPALWRFVEEFPMTPLGKIQKFRMRDYYAREGSDGGN